MSRDKELFCFLQSLIALKNVKRKGWVDKLKLSDAESVADHSYSVAAISMLVSDILGLDSEKSMKMAILHDLAEAITGDFTPDEICTKQKLDKEQDAITSLLSCLPERIFSNYIDIWNEYVSGKTETSKLIHRIDKLEMALQASEYARKTKSSEIDQFMTSARKAVTNEEKQDILTNILNALMSN